MRIITDSTGMARLAFLGRVRERSEPVVTAFTATRLRAGRMTSRMAYRFVASVADFQWRAWRSRNSSANSVIGRQGYFGPPPVASSVGSVRRASLWASGRLIRPADPSVPQSTLPRGWQAQDEAAGRRSGRRTPPARRSRRPTPRTSSGPARRNVAGKRRSGTAVGHGAGSFSGPRGRIESARASFF